MIFYHYYYYLYYDCLHAGTVVVVVVGRDDDDGGGGDGGDFVGVELVFGVDFVAVADSVDVVVVAVGGGVVSGDCVAAVVVGVAHDFDIFGFVVVAVVRDSVAVVLNQDVVVNVVRSVGVVAVDDVAVYDDVDVVDGCGGGDGVEVYCFVLYLYCLSLKWLLSLVLQSDLVVVVW